MRTRFPPHPRCLLHPEARSQYGTTVRFRSPALAAMQATHRLKSSPLGPYHYKMIAENFVFDTRRSKERLGWQPTLTDEQMLLRAYRYYAQHRHEIHARKNVSAHRKPASMGVIRLRKWFS